MNNKVNYAMIGFLVLVGIAMIFAFSIWMMKPTDTKDVQNYTIYFNESVFGLNIDAPVKYRGISVGKVTNLEINPKNTEQIKVTAQILKSTPIKTSTVAKLTAQGITGLTYINLSMGKQNTKLLEVTDGEEYPVIKSAPSFFEDLEKSFGSVSLRLSSTLEKTESLLKDENQVQISKILEKSANILAKVDKLLDEKTIMHIQNTAKNLDSFSHKLDSAMPNVDKLVLKSIEWEENIFKSFDSIMYSYIEITKTMDEIQRAVVSGEFNIKAISEEILPTVDATLLEMQNTMIKMDDFMQHYEDSPSDLFYKKEIQIKAPGEK
jgi:phospholipid/cholesterol/gamma-HCH transport system substrate-binding protein